MGPIFLVPERCQSRAYRGAGGMVFGVAAPKGFDESPTDGGITARSKAAFARMTQILEAADLTRANVCSVTVYLDDVLRDVGGFNAVLRSYFDGFSPARCCVGVTLRAGMLVETAFFAEQWPSSEIEDFSSREHGRTR